MPATATYIRHRNPAVERQLPLETSGDLICKRSHREGCTSLGERQPNAGEKAESAAGGLVESAGKRIRQSDRRIRVNPIQRCNQWRDTGTGGTIAIICDAINTVKVDLAKAAPEHPFWSRGIGKADAW